MNTSAQFEQPGQKMDLDSRIRADLAKSGLIPEDMDIRPATHLEFAAIHANGNSHLQGYTIPYYDLFGKLRTFYRVRMFDPGTGAKYRQPKNSSNHIYFPKTFQELVIAALNVQESSNGTTPAYIAIVEGEKKAAALAKLGIPAIGLGGVDSWRNRSFSLPTEVELSKSNKDTINAKLPAGSEDLLEQDFSALASGFVEFVDYVVPKEIQLVIIYDRDINLNVPGHNGMKTEVQRAAATLGAELRFRGIAFSRIRQLILPATDKLPRDSKVGADDFMQVEGAGKLKELLWELTTSERSAFPQHPNIREYVGKKLQKSKMSRKESQALTLAILSDLDANGRRLWSADESRAYYFDQRTTKLVRANLNMTNKGLLHETQFGQMLYGRYGLSAADLKVLTWLDAQFHGEQPVKEVTPYRLFARPKPGENVIRVQISDSQYVRITDDDDFGKAIRIMTNGDDGYLFEAGQTVELKGKDLQKQLVEHYNLWNLSDPESKMPCWWADVLTEVRLRDRENAQRLASILFYVSPWLYKWRGSQLPVELIIGESGSGKSSLYEHRLNVLTGTPKLRNAPRELRDWQASISNTGGLHVTDNVQLLDKSLRQQLSDEICRLITEPIPHIEARKLYSDNELIRMPVDCVFGITAIKQPFVQADLLARSVILELDKSEATDTVDGVEGIVTYDAEWVPRQMSRFGGRVSWMSHQILAVYQFLKLAKQRWNPGYKAMHRLINLEQSMMLMGEVFGQDMDWLPKHITITAQDATADSDWVLEGLIAFSNNQIVNKQLDKRFTAGDISTWAMQQPMYQDCSFLVNARSLGKYLQQHKNVVAQSAGLFETGARNNSVLYMVKSTRQNTKGLTGQ